MSLVEAIINDRQVNQIRSLEDIFQQFYVFRDKHGSMHHQETPMVEDLRARHYGSIADMELARTLASAIEKGAGNPMYDSPASQRAVESVMACDELSEEKIQELEKLNGPDRFLGGRVERTPEGPRFSHNSTGGSLNHLWSRTVTTTA